MKCTAHKTNGEPCRAWAVIGRTVCRVHGAGGNQLAKSTAANTKHGRYSRYATVILAQKSDKLLEDPLNLTDEITLARAVLQDFLGKFEDGKRLRDQDADAILSKLESISRVVSVEVKRRGTLTQAQAIVFLARVMTSVNESINEHIGDAETANRVRVSIRDRLAGMVKFDG